MKNHFVITRLVTFELKQKGKFHCGQKAKGGLQTIQVIADCTCKPYTDRRGFLFRNELLQEIVDSIGTAIVSCEVLSVWIAANLLRKIREDNRKCRVTQIAVTVSPYPHRSQVRYSAKVGKGGELKK